MPTDELSCLAFDSIGRLFVGTQCEGVLIASAEEEFKSWRQIKGVDSPPATATGQGLPSNQINDILVCDDETLYVATSTGLAHSTDFGETWDFLRGADWQKKAQGLRSPLSTQAPTGNIEHQLLREDYVTNLAEDARGLLWIGYRRQGYEARRPLVDRATFLSPAQNDGNFPYVSAMLPVGEDAVALGYYNAGISMSERVPRFVPTQAEQAAFAARRGWKDNFDPATPVAPFPSAATEPDAAELQRLLALVQNHPKTPDAAPKIALMPDDWTTQGDWLGRYGRHWADLCAMISPQDLIWGAGAEPVEFKWNIGPNHSDDDSTRYWVHWLQSDSKRALELPPMYGDSRAVKGFESNPNKLRRQSEVDDHGEAYPMEHEGPNLRCVLKVPKGDFVLSLYNHNKDGHENFNRARDYIL